MKNLGNVVKAIGEKLTQGMIMIGLMFIVNFLTEGAVVNDLREIVTVAIEASDHIGEKVEDVNPEMEWAKTFSKEEAKAELERLEEMYDKIEITGFEDITDEVRTLQNKISALRERITGIKHEFSYCF